MSNEIQDKLQICLSFILERLEVHKNHRAQNEVPPFFLGINGVQGIGKTSLVASIARTLDSAPHHISTVVLSIDDFYLPHEDQKRLAANYHQNPLIQHRGQPPTHDLDLIVSVLASLRDGLETSIPAYDKSAFNGEGDRVPQSQWAKANVDQQQPIELVILEGWCVGFRALSHARLSDLWKTAAQSSKRSTGYSGRLGYNRQEDVEFVNSALKGYDVVTDQLDGLIHLDAENPQFVYQWRLEQEAALRKERGSGMTDEEVITFVDGYYPSYELFTEQLRAGAFENRRGNQLRLVVAKDRSVVEVVRI
ncbi:MAG: hypothetical protein Q9222_006347 [Ikaeria aurantiellina]